MRIAAAVVRVIEDGVGEKTLALGVDLADPNIRRLARELGRVIEATVLELAEGPSAWRVPMAVEDAEVKPELAETQPG